MYHAHTICRMKRLFRAAVRTLSLVIDTIAPPKARTARLHNISVESIPLSPSTHTLLGVSITTLMDYAEQSVRDLVQSLKYDGSGTSAQLLASTVAEYLLEELDSEKRFSTKRIVLMPVPLHPSRKRERGFNQIEEVLRRLPVEYRDGTLSTLRTDMLVRTKATKQQTRLSRNERLSNVAGAFALSSEKDLSGLHIYVFDDVTTTGATLANAATPLHRAGATVSLIALARA